MNQIYVYANLIMINLPIHEIKRGENQLYSQYLFFVYGLEISCILSNL